ncbi:protein fem-1 homolog A-like [Palaemon carinicauda]|uniref:protein fem-1 homolog A-like n=1 Tax=Palaemon carinicauda TaxID=392227 RepID=UPI0035B5ECE4
MGSTECSFVCVTQIFSVQKVSCVEKSQEGWGTLLTTAATLGHTKCLKILVEDYYAHLDEVVSGGGAKDANRLYYNPLRVASTYGHFDIVKLLLEYGIDVDAKDSKGITCLMMAAYNRRRKILKYLIRKGADVNKKTINGKHALHACAESGDLEAMKILLRHNARMDADSFGITPLLTASSFGHRHIVQYLVNKKDMVSTMDRLNAMELLGATFIGRMQHTATGVQLWKSALDLRYENGILVHPKAGHHLTYPSHEDLNEIITLEQLQAIELDDDAMLLQALLWHTVKSAVYKLVKIDPRNSDSVPLLHFACAPAGHGKGMLMKPIFPCLGVVSLLLEVGADPCATDNQGNTPLHMLACNIENFQAILNALLLAGAHLDASNRLGQTSKSIRASRRLPPWQVNVLRQTSLQCLAAACIKRHGIPYKTILPPKLAQFVDMH